ncbi:hypothetical protein I6I18_06450 [Kytococcus sedentarius]|uniref:hypothetical protein n=1 Tax=Kytococcus sedentarius TaxID=1276 RepID=UPI00019EA965|nr:hypothetical protein [Kytococcus sedentarius]QQB65027.1 hypothetical protein I6I18_06450 [Kytococcus sedentarius]STX14430.1 Uncharacterised protein [Kytococcus sedentarius]
MPRTHRLLAAGFAASLALSLPVSASAFGGAPALGQPVLAAHHASESHAAADWIVAQLAGEDHFAAGGDTVDALVALAAAGNHDDVAKKLGTYLQNSPDAKGYASVQPGAAAKVVIGLDAVCMDTSAYDQLMTADMDAEGNLPGFASAFNHALVIIALERSGQEIPPQLVTKLKSWQTAADGGFEYDDFMTGEKVYDVDGGAMGAMALKVAGEEAAADRALDSLRAHQEGPGYWPNYSPVNSTGLVVHAMEIDDRDVSKAQAWMKTQQLTDGGFPASLDGDKSNVMATIQGMQGIAGAGYTNADIGCATPSPEPTTPEPTTPEPTSPEPTTPEPTTPEPTSPEPTTPEPTTPEPTSPEPTTPEPTTPEPTSPEPSETDPTGPVVDTGVTTGGNGELAVAAMAGLLTLAGGTVAASRLRRDGK